MKFTRLNLILAVVAASLLLGGGALAEVVQETYSRVRKRSDGGAVGVYRTDLSSDDSATATTPIDPQPTDTDPAVVVLPTGSAASATVTVEAWLYHSSGGTSPTYTLMGISAVQTATFGSLRRDGASGKYLPLQPLVFSTYGADVYDIRIRSVSSGTVDLRAWTAGAMGRAAE